MKITSFQNPRLKLVKKLRDKKGRESEGRFVIDYERDLERALHHGYQVDYALYCPALGRDDALRAVPRQVVYEVSRDVMEKVSYRENPSAFVVVMHSKAARTAQDLNAVTDDLILGLVNLQKPGNIGALLRSADAMGFKTVFLIDMLLDLYNPNLIRSSTGASFLDNLYMLTSDEAITFLRSRGYNILSAHLQGDRMLYEVDFKRKSAVILGTEDVGLNENWVENCDHLVKIPMVGELSDSLNVSVSGAIFMYEALRQSHS
jgi:RNA methyltransferase, TrmH family